MRRRTFVVSGLSLAACAVASSDAPAPLAPSDVAAAPPAVAAPPPAPMITRPLPRTGEPLPVIGLADWPGRSDPASTSDPLTALLAADGRLIDVTATEAGEQAAGERLAAAGLVRRVFLAARVRVPGRRAGLLQMEQTLDRLGRRAIDLMQVHTLAEFATHLLTLRRWRVDGHARYIGAAIDATAELPALAGQLPTAGLDTVQLPYSIFDRAAEAELLPAAAAHGVAVLVTRPLGGSDALAAVRGRPLPALADALACTSWDQLLIKWVLADPAVRCVLPTAAELRASPDLLRAGHGPLPDEAQRRELAALVARAAHGRPR